MEALSGDFTKEANNNITESENTAEMSSCWVLMDPDSAQKVTNTDIILCINEHHKSLDEDHEVGVKINHLGKDIVFYIDHIAHQNQSMIYFKGHTENGKLVHFVKHSSELNIELQSLKRRVTDLPKIPYGLDSWDVFDELKLQYV